MIKELRENFNRGFNDDNYQNFLVELESQNGSKIEFRIAETPIFLPGEFKHKILQAVNDIVSTITSEHYLANVSRAVPSGLLVPGEMPHSDMLSIDFAICLDENGSPTPRLIELQGFPSLYFYQVLLDRMFRKYFDIPNSVDNYFGGLDEESYIALLREVIIDGADPENVVLLEIEPHKQKTLVDFVMTEKMLGIDHVCISDVIKEGKNLYYRKNGKTIRIDRIYNRVIFDELLARDDIKYSFQFQEELDVKWIPHPNWFFKISKYSLPYFDTEYVPQSRFLSEYDEYPTDIENYILKPLFSFAGSGVKFDVSHQLLDTINDPENFILQRKIEYAPIIETPDIPAKAELRILMVWDKDKKTYIPINNLVRLSKGKMMGVDFNKNKTWVGSSIAYFEKD
ncbi:MAG TPA: hypothetical protein VK004_05885 [Ignavibacteria bacterium]|nr:hypothetical protein [Ignavibacteria bacterium]